MALGWRDLTAEEQAAALVWTEDNRAATTRRAVADEAKLALDIEQAIWRQDALQMTPQEYETARPIRDAAVEAKHAAWLAAQRS